LLAENKKLTVSAPCGPSSFFNPTGVYGEIADRMADIMQEMGEQNRQVISITHLPQIAARGRAHYKVYKRDNDTETF